MNKLSTEMNEYLNTLLNVSAMCEIDEVAIENDIVRGASADVKRGIYILETENIPQNMEFTSLGIRGVKTLKSRMSILDGENIKVEYDSKTKDNGDVIVKKLVMSSKKTKVDFSCADVSTIRSPKVIKDPDHFSFVLTDDTIKVMTKIKNAITGVEDISFSSEKDGSIKFVVHDERGDMFDHTIADSYEKLDEGTKNHFYNKYKIKYVSALFKAAMDLEGTAKIILSSRGVIKMVVKGITIRIVPEVD